MKTEYEHKEKETEIKVIIDKYYPFVCDLVDYSKICITEENDRYYMGFAIPNNVGKGNFILEVDA